LTLCYTPHSFSKWEGTARESWVCLTRRLSRLTSFAKNRGWRFARWSWEFGTNWNFLAFTKDWSGRIPSTFSADNQALAWGEDSKVWFTMWWSWHQ
jgi:hypothetical protein